jgi:hypothetical protein
VFTFLQRPASLNDIVEPLDVVRAERQRQAERIQAAIAAVDTEVMSAFALGLAMVQRLHRLGHDGLQSDFSQL